MAYISTAETLYQPPAALRAPKKLPSPPSSRYVGIGFVVLLHVGIVYALVTGLAEKVVTVPPKPLQIMEIKEAKTQDDQVPPPPPKLKEPPPAFIPPPEVSIAFAPAATTAIQAVTTRPAEPATVVAPPHAVVRVEPILDSDHSADPEYPPMSRRMGEEGIVSLLVLVAPDGTVADVRVERSSGHSRLDEAAISGARTSCKFKPGSLDGKSSSMWYRYRYQFKLN